jgi:precorrin-2/cobalt-factor-2 C20-methyltransferase
MDTGGRQMAGIMYGIGVGPGDPELMTLKAVRRIREMDVIAIPHSDKNNCTAYQIAKAAVPEIEEKECLYLPMPMTKDKKILEDSHESAAKAVMERLDRGENVGFITLGDVTIYSTCSYLLERLWNEGYATQLESGITSFCAVSARLGIPLVTGAEELHVIPASYQIKEALKLSGVKVLMKAGRQMKTVKEEIRACGLEAVMVENCGMSDERVYHSLLEIPDEAGYYSLIIVR